MTLAFDRFRKSNSPDQAPETTRKPVPFLARLSGRDWLVKKLESLPLR